MSNPIPRPDGTYIVGEMTFQEWAEWWRETFHEEPFGEIKEER